MTDLVLIAGHLVVGLAYYLREYGMLTKEEYQKELDEGSKKYSSQVVALFQNKKFVLCTYLLAGYFNIGFHIKRVLKGEKK